MNHSTARKIHTLAPAMEREAGETFTRWSEALKRRSPAELTELYADDAVLIPTLWPEPQKTPHALNTYFTMLTAREGLEVRINEAHLQMMDEVTAVHSGIYTFYFEEEGKQRSLPSRFTFIYRNGSDGWKIVHHHSSQLPSKPNGQ